MTNVVRDVIQLILNNLYLIGVLALITTGIALTYKTANVANFAQAITSTVGAYVAGWLVRDAGCNVWLALVAGVLACFIIGAVMDSVLIRHIAGGNGRIMVTIGLIVLITAGIPLVFGTIPYNIPRFFKGQVDFTVFGMQFNITKNALFVAGLSAVVIGIIFLALNLTKWGLGVRGTASNMYVAAMMGVNTNLMTALSWAISSALGALAAILLASQTQVINITMLGTVQANSLLAFVLGGFTSFYGPALGAVIIPILLSLLALISGIWSSALTYMVAMLIILIKPAGLFGKVTQKKV